MKYTPKLLTAPRTLVHDDSGHYTASGMRVPDADVRSRDIAEQAARWLAFTEDRSRMMRHTLVAKVLTSVAFSVQHQSRSLAVPSKLVGTKANQRALWTMVDNRVPAWSELSLDDTGSGLVVRYCDDVLGEIQRKHVPWVRPLVPFGLRLYLARVTGHDFDFTLGCNVVFGHVGQALDGLLVALGQSGDGASGRPVLAPSDVPKKEAQSGDGAAHNATLAVSQAPEAPEPLSHLRLVVRPEHDAVRPGADPDDIVLYRRVDGTACASVEHVVRHSPTGIDWGRSGSGPADLALSVLAALVDESTAEALYPAFQADVISLVPFAGGVLRAADVHDWIARQSA